jgi:predicted transcriptional regulator
MNLIKHIRTDILKVSQAELARIAGVNQAQICRWEKGTVPHTIEALGRIRTEVKSQGHEWNDEWTFMPVKSEVEPA